MLLSLTRETQNPDDRKLQQGAKTKKDVHLRQRNVVRRPPRKIAGYIAVYLHSPVHLQPPVNIGGPIIVCHHAACQLHVRHLIIQTEYYTRKKQKIIQKISAAAQNPGRP